jgi:hypothetical protein
MRVTPDADEIVQGSLRDQRPTNRMDEIAGYMSDDNTVLTGDYEKGRRAGMKNAQSESVSTRDVLDVKDWEAYHKGITDGEELIKSLKVGR